MADKVAFTLENIAKIGNGRVAKQFESLLQRIVLDCLARPADETARKITLTASIIPKLGDDTAIIECDGVAVDFEITAKVPTHRSPTYSMGVNKNAQLWFKEDSPDDHRQQTLGDLRDGGDQDAT